MGTVILDFSCNKKIKLKLRLSIIIMCNAKPEYHTGGQSVMSLMALKKKSIQSFCHTTFSFLTYYISNFIYLITKSNHI
jgi:hypothetical protein